MSNKTFTSMLTEEKIDEKQFKYNVLLVNELESMVKSLKKGDYSFNDSVEVRKAIEKLQSFLTK